MVYFYGFSQTIWANCPDDVQVINKGDVANCDGVLLSPDASKKANEAIEDSKYYKDLTDRLYKRQEYTTKEMNILDQRLKLYQDESQVLATELSRRESTSKLEKYIFFGLGVFATGIAVYGASKIIR